MSLARVDHPVWAHKALLARFGVVEQFLPAEKRAAELQIHSASGERKARK